MAGNVPTVSFISAWTKFTTTHSDELIVELSRSINVSLLIIIIVLHFVLIQGQYDQVTPGEHGFLV